MWAKIKQKYNLKLNMFFFFSKEEEKKEFSFYCLTKDLINYSIFGV